MLPLSVVHPYIMRGRDSGKYKIGVAKNIRSRYSTHRLSCSEDLDVVFLGSVETEGEAKDWEGQTLRRYKPHTLHGEWLAAECGIAVEIKSGTVGGIKCEEIPFFAKNARRHHVDGVKDKFVLIRMEKEQREQFERAAKREGKTVSSWLRDLGAAAIAPPPEPERWPRGAPAHVQTILPGRTPEPWPRDNTPQLDRQTPRKPLAKETCPTAQFGKSAEAFLAERGIPIKAGAGLGAGAHTPSKGIIARDPEAVGHARTVHKLIAEFAIDPGTANEKLLELSHNEMPPPNCASWATFRPHTTNLINWLNEQYPVEETVVLRAPANQREEDYPF